MKIYGLEAAEKFDEFNGVIKKLFDVYATSACATSKKKGAEMHVHQLQIQSDPVHNTDEFDDIFNENDSSHDHEQHFQRFLLERSYKTQAIINELDIESVERHLANLLIVEKEENNDDMEQDDVLMDEMDE
uniref:Uncharacterized protein n=1 Tax=Oryza rufipogon TaxID=4529 RepID=A0A0E0RHC2_ORYRU